MSEPVVDELAEAVLDGVGIDWGSAERRLTSREDHAIATELRALSTLAIHPRALPARAQEQAPPPMLLGGIREFVKTL